MALLASSHLAYAAPLLPLEFLALIIVGVVYWRGSRAWTKPLAATIYFALMPGSLWVLQFELWQRSNVGAVYTINAFQNIAFGIGFLVWVSFRKRFAPVLAGLLLVYVVSQLLQYFSYLYWSAGSAGNFNQPLTHLDSLFFALGTLTTAGTGNVVATSEKARLLQTVQMGLDFTLIVFAVGLILIRYSLFLAQNLGRRTDDTNG
jgi:hypothetical protein